MINQPQSTDLEHGYSPDEVEQVAKRIKLANPGMGRMTAHIQACRLLANDPEHGGVA